MGGVSFEDAGQLLQVDRERAQHGCGQVAERGFELLGEIVVTLPCAFPQLLGAPPGQVGRFLDALGQGNDQPIARALEQVAPRSP